MSEHTPRKEWSDDRTYILVCRLCGHSWPCTKAEVPARDEVEAMSVVALSGTPIHLVRDTATKRLADLVRGGCPPAVLGSLESVSISELAAGILQYRFAVHPAPKRRRAPALGPVHVPF